MEAIADPPAYNRARAAVRFDEISRALVHALKYGDRLDLAPMMGRWIAQAGRELLAEADALVPVPLHWRRLWARRFNQSAMLAAAISAESGVPVAAARAQARQSDGAAGRADANRTRRQRAGRVPRAGTTARPAVVGPPARPGRRRADLRRHGRGLRPGAAARRRRQCRCAGFRQGCRSGANVHINELDKLTHHHGRIDIYTIRYCPYCQDAKELLSRKGVSFHEIDVTGNRDIRKQMIERANGRSTFPQIFIGATHVGGCDDLYALEEAGKLDPLLGASAKDKPA